MKKNFKKAVAVAVINEMGYTYDAQIIIDALVEKEAYIFSKWHLQTLEGFMEKLSINRKIEKDDGCYKVTEVPECE